ncbi:MAG TPA: response regulator [Blastocatellia bacterium]|nr:response regulator [Blastocatellia bacterium]
MTKKILIVEDTPETCDILTILLELSGYDVIVARDGVHGLEQVHAHQPDLIITDMQMPRMDGGAMIKELRTLPLCRDLPILAITAHGKERAEEAIISGASCTLLHPIEDESLLPLVRTLLKNKPPRPFAAL